MHHILVPIDFSEAAQAALAYAVELSQHLHSRITLLHVSCTAKVSETLLGLDAFEYLSKTLELPAASSGIAPSFNVDELRKVAKKKLEESIDPAWRERVRIETAFDEGRPSLKIVQYARDHEVDMIVMGTHGRGPVANFFLGSVTENVIRSATCPVLTIRGKS